MTTPSPGPAHQGKTNMVAALETTGILVLANLPDAASVPAGTFAYTTDYGVVVSNGSSWQTQHGRTINVQVLTGATYVPSSTAYAVTVIAVGDGGGGGGASGASASFSAAGGGGSGAVGILNNYVLAHTQWTLSIGSGGAAGAAAAGNGGNGAGTTITDSASNNVLTAPGGGGGPGATAGITALISAGGVPATVATCGVSSSASSMILTTGQQGSFGYTGAAAGVNVSGAGGNTLYGAGGVASTGSAGAVGTGYGSGGSGGCSTAGSNVLGGAGAPGIVIIYEYS